MKKLIHKLYGGLRFTWPRLIAYAVAAAALVVILILWLIFSRPAEPVPEEMGSSAKAIMMGMELLL